ncbi:hypothetical protein ACA910_017812 [Epithemia clementina (nom. ined.)]
MTTRSSPAQATQVLTRSQPQPLPFPTPRMTTGPKQPPVAANAVAVDLSAGDIVFAPPLTRSRRLQRKDLNHQPPGKARLKKPPPPPFAPGTQNGNHKEVIDLVGDDDSSVEEQNEVVFLSPSTNKTLSPKDAPRKRQRNTTVAAAAAAAPIENVLPNLVAAQTALNKLSGLVGGNNNNTTTLEVEVAVLRVREVIPTASRQEVIRLAHRYQNNVEAILNELFAVASGEVTTATSRTAHNDDDEVNSVHLIVQQDAKVAAKQTVVDVPMAVEGDLTAGVTTLHRERKVWSYDFMAVASSSSNTDEEDSENDKSNEHKKSAQNDTFRLTEEYMMQAQKQLFCDFPFLSKDGAKSIMRNTDAHSGRRHYAIAHHVILQAIQTAKEDNSVSSPKGRKKQKVQVDKKKDDDIDPLVSQYRLVQRALAGFALNAKQKENLATLGTSDVRVFVKNPRKPASRSSISNDDNSNLDSKPSATAPAVTNDILLEEMEYVQQKLQDWLNMARNHIQRKRNQERAQQTNTGVECMCCFDSFLIEDMCACRDEGHLFCVDCLKGYADTQIFGSGNLGAVDKDTKRPAMDLLCFHADCKSVFSRDILEKALPRQTMEKYDQLQFQIAVQAASLTNLVTCPKCDFQVQVDSDPKSHPKFTCPMDDCKFESCRLCRLPWHDKNVSCDEARQKAHAQTGRHGVEEAMSMAKIRSCPTCHKAFLKETGCNKIQCTSCQTLSCYVCRQVISKEVSYNHFCQTPHCTHKTCGKCRLWTKDDEKQDETAVRQAGLEAAAAMDQSETVVDQLLLVNNRAQQRNKSAQRRRRR